MSSGNTLTARGSVALLSILTCLAVTDAASAQGKPSDICFTAGFTCSTQPVPLDRSGAVPGTVTLNVVRKLAGPDRASTAVVPLAGGPGQAAVPITSDFARVLGPGLATRDLLVFDQRGTGGSGPLDCTSLRSRTLSRLAAVQRCVKALGATRAFYRTADSVEDLEALRAALGYDKLVLYAVSYGTRLAFDYASAHPDRVESLILDSVVPQAGIDPFSRPTFAAIPGMLADLCRADCPFAPNPTKELGTLARRLGNGPLRASVYTGSGKRVKGTLYQEDLANTLIVGDLDPAGRAALPGAVHAAVRGDVAPLLRLAAASSGSGGSQDPNADVDSTAYLATTCEEQLLPWKRTATSVSARRSEITAAVAALDPASVAPFRREVAAVASGPVITCLGWPAASPAPAVPGPLPAVPTLVLEGAGDLRTPAAQARAAVAAIPNAQVVVVPRAGHSVLGADSTGCATAAVAAFFAAQAIAQCTKVPASRAPKPPPPTRFADVKPAGGTSGRVGRTLAVVRATVSDAFVMALAGVGGLRGGTIGVNDAFTAIRLRDDSYVKGVEVSGSLQLSSTRTSVLQVSGSAAAHGTVRITASGKLSGTLGGKKVADDLATAARSARVRAAATARAHAPAATR